jgi:hypothetical protein
MFLVEAGIATQKVYTNFTIANRIWVYDDREEAKNHRNYGLTKYLSDRLPDR